MGEKIKSLLLSESADYQNIKITYKKIEPLNIDNLKEYIGRTIYYSIKFANVTARNAKLGEIVDTKPLVRYRDKIFSFSEVKCFVDKTMVKNGAKVVKDPSGEEYVISTEKKFLQKYKKQNNCFVPISGILRFVKVIENICFDKKGEIVYVPKGCYLCLDDLTRSITNVAFEETYKVEKRAKLIF